MNIILAVAAGGAIGATGRFLVGRLMFGLMGPGYPWGTLTVNVVGSFLIGLLYEMIVYKFSLSETWQAFLVIGILGGFTTFSAFTMELGMMLEKDQLSMAAFYALVSVFLGLVALFAGIFAGKVIY